MKALLKPVILKVINLIESLHEALMNHPLVVRQAEKTMENAIRVMAVMAVVTRREVRLYSMEGQHLSRKRGEMKRMTWYTSPITAKEIGEYMGRLTGRLVYIDLTISIMSPYSHRFYKRGDEAFILKGELMAKAKHRWKYFKQSDFEKYVEDYNKVVL